MTPYTQAIWKELRQRAGPSGALPTVRRDAFCGTHGYTANDVEAAIADLIHDGAVSALDDKELAKIVRHKNLSGDFLIWSRESCDSVFLRIRTPAEVQRAWTAHRELSSRELANWEHTLQAAEHELSILRRTAAKHPQATENDSVLALFYSTLNGYFFAHWSEAVTVAADDDVTSEEVNTVITAVRKDPTAARSMIGAMMSEMESAGRARQELRTFRIWSIVWLLSRYRARSRELQRTINETVDRVATIRSFLSTLTQLVSFLEVETGESAERRRDAIPKPVQQEVWRRDQGRCVQCGSQERLHFDHVIPASRGGASTVRNVQLLCERCNLAKGDTI